MYNFEENEDDISMKKEELMMKIREIMTTDVSWLKPDDTVETAANIMQKLDVGILPICNENKDLIGLLTDRDIVIRNVAKGKDAKDTSVKDIMSSKLTWGTPDMDVADACETMAIHQIRRLPIVENNSLVGIVSLGDIVLQSDFDIEASQTLCDICERDWKRE